MQNNRTIHHDKQVSVPKEAADLQKRALKAKTRRKTAHHTRLGHFSPNRVVSGGFRAKYPRLAYLLENYNLTIGLIWAHVGYLIFVMIIMLVSRVRA